MSCKTCNGELSYHTRNPFFDEKLGYYEESSHNGSHFFITYLTPNIEVPCPQCLRKEAYIQRLEEVLSNELRILLDTLRRYG